jgi:hypothetical protein
MPLRGEPPAEPRPLTRLGLVLRLGLWLEVLIAFVILLVVIGWIR